VVWIVNDLGFDLPSAWWEHRRGLMLLRKRQRNLWRRRRHQHRRRTERRWWKPFLDLVNDRRGRRARVLRRWWWRRARMLRRWQWSWWSRVWGGVASATRSWRLTEMRCGRKADDRRSSLQAERLEKRIRLFFGRSFLALFVRFVRRGWSPPSGRKLSHFSDFLSQDADAVLIAANLQRHARGQV
jgi:hypothetical protein